MAASFAVVARPADFDDRDLHLMRCLQRPLAALHAVGQGTPAERSAPSGTAAGSDLTARELDVLSLVAEGLLARTIASRLAVSTRTVNKHLENVYRKLGAHDRLVAVLRAEGLGIISRQRPRPIASPEALTVRW